MKNLSVHNESDLEAHQEPLPEGMIAFHFKMVAVGPNTMAKAEHLGAKICQIVREQPGYFLLSPDGSGLREAMHGLVDDFCDAQTESSNEPKT